MKIFAYYLPQFHCIPENDEWWGKGFTEWTNVKKAKPLYKGHVQPKVPKDNNYYRLDDVETLKWQGDLLNKYNVDGLIFYHYYFKGKKLLEKPGELLLENKNININYFFCWANHSWYRSWEGSKKILLDQTYGDEKDWEEHFMYLLPFFKDSRYEKKDNKPILMIFNSEFDEKKEIFNFFNKKCIENGFDGIYLVETKFNEKQCKNQKENEQEYTSVIHYREPNFALNLYKKNITHLPKRIFDKIVKTIGNEKLKITTKYDGNKIYKEMCHKSYYDKKNIIKGAFFEWDNTPRHSYRGYVITPVNKKMFNKYMSLIKSDEYLFLNAWNEWAEGMMLEPTVQNNYKYLEWIKEVKK